MHRASASKPEGCPALGHDAEGNMAAPALMDLMLVMANVLINVASLLIGKLTMAKPGGYS